MYPRTDYSQHSACAEQFTANHKASSSGRGGKLRQTEGSGRRACTLPGRRAGWLYLQNQVITAPATSLIRLSSRPHVSYLPMSRTDQRKAQGHLALTYGGQAGHTEPCKCRVPVPINSDFLIKLLGRARWRWAAGPGLGLLD